jgi:hypothetical protein
MISPRDSLILTASFCLVYAAPVSAQDLAPDEPDPPFNIRPVIQPELPAVPRKQSATKFGNITVVGSNQQIRGGIASMARGVFTELNELCSQKQRQLKIPIVIRLYGTQGDVKKKRSIASDIVLIEGQYQLNIHIHLARGIDWSKLRYHVMEMLLYERGLGNGQVVEDGERVLVKPWLVVGLLEVLNIRANRSDRKLYQSEIPYLEILSLQSIFDTSESKWLALAGLKPIAFRAISGAMVSSLVRQPKGKSSVASYLADFATFKGEAENLMRQHFPSMNQSSNSLEKWLNLEMLELGTAKVSEVFSIFETEKRLNSILVLRYRDEEDVAKTIPIHDYADVIQLKSMRERSEAVAGVRAELSRISYRCFPTYRPLIYEYDMIVSDIVTASADNIDTRLKNLSIKRQQKKNAATRVRDYLDWYDITQSKEITASFREYREFSDKLGEKALRRKEDDFTNNYLERVQRIYGGEKSN